MGLQIDLGAANDPFRTEASTLKQFGLRWAILAAWRDELIRRGEVMAPTLASRLETARVKIASGCFSSCEVGCDLAAVEGDLGAVDASTDQGTISFWIELLGRAMTDGGEVQKLLRIPVIRAHFINCGRACRCPE